MSITTHLEIPKNFGDEEQYVIEFKSSSLTAEVGDYEGINFKKKQKKTKTLLLTNCKEKVTIIFLRLN